MTIPARKKGVTRIFDPNPSDPKLAVDRTYSAAAEDESFAAPPIDAEESTELTQKLTHAEAHLNCTAHLSARHKCTGLASPPPPTPKKVLRILPSKPVLRRFHRSPT